MEERREGDRDGARKRGREVKKGGRSLIKKSLG